ncbi:MAG: hypothetical protein WAT67_12040 [Candidatus Contendobacter sp.]
MHETDPKSGRQTSFFYIQALDQWERMDGWEKLKLIFGGCQF